MKIFISIITLMLCSLFTACGTGPNLSAKGRANIDKSSANIDPIHLGNETLPYDANAVVKKAMADFNLAVSGNIPYFAKPDTTKNSPGSETVVFEGEGYILKVLCNPAILGDVSGYYYGPVLSFTKFTSTEGKPGLISNVQFYTRDEISKLHKNKTR